VDVYTHRTGRRHHICAVRSRESRAAAFPPLSCPDPCERSGSFSVVAYFSQPSYRSLLSVCVGNVAPGPHNGDIASDDAPRADRRSPAGRAACRDDRSWPRDVSVAWEPPAFHTLRIIPEGGARRGDEGPRAGIQFRDAFGQGQQHEGDGFGTAQRQLPRLRVIQLAAQRRLQKRIDLGVRRLPCHTLALTENDPGRKLPIYTLPRRVDCRRLKSYEKTTR